MSRRRGCWGIEHFERQGVLCGEVACMDTKFDNPWLWRVMIGWHVLAHGRVESREEAVTKMMDAWDKMDERLSAV